MGKYLRYTTIFLYIVVVVIMATTTIIEKYHGTVFASDHFYGSWWFCLLWALLSATGVACLFRQYKFLRHKFSNLLLHLSWVIILAGAILTHLFSERGSVHLRQGAITNTYTCLQSQNTQKALPFCLRLDSFHVSTHSGTTSASDYITEMTVIDNNRQYHAIISMNNIYSHRGYRFYQSGYDSDGKGSTLSINADPWGIPVTYTGYALLFLSLLWLLANPKGTFRQLLRSPLLRQGVFLLLLMTVTVNATASETTSRLPVLPKETAAKFGKLLINYKGRICPMQTFAIDFTKKLCGKTHYKDYTAEQVLLGFIFWSDAWSQEPVIRVKGSALRVALHLPTYCSVNTFFDNCGYRIGPYIRKYYDGSQDKLCQQALQVDDRLQLIMDLRRGVLLKIFPYTFHNVHGTSEVTTWYTPTDYYPTEIDSLHQKYMRDLFSVFYHDAMQGNIAHIDELVSDLIQYQRINAGKSAPTMMKLKAEHIYNTIPFTTFLFIINLTMGLFTLTLFLLQLMGKHIPAMTKHLCTIIFLLSFFALTTTLLLRWVIKGSIPMSNGYETMLVIAWFIMLICQIPQFTFFRLSSLLTTFGFLLSGFFLLVSHISQMDPQISHLMPVLNSPLLTLHVSITMMAYAFLSLTFICGIMGYCMPRQEMALKVLSQLFLYPALTCLGLGIFIGAIWANISWGCYWSWDPKETWALITLMVYAAAVHQHSIPWMRYPRHYHFYMLLSFLTLLMTYFGVNYFLGGMHSYA